MLIIPNDRRLLDVTFSDQKVNLFASYFKSIYKVNCSVDEIKIY